MSASNSRTVPGVMTVMSNALNKKGVRDDSNDELTRRENALKLMQNEYFDADEPNLLDEDDMHVFDLYPLSDHLNLVCCKLCQRPLKETHYASHYERCKVFLSQKGKKESDPIQSQSQSQSQHQSQNQNVSSIRPQRRSRKKFEEGNVQEENFTAVISKAARTKKNYSNLNNSIVNNNAGKGNMNKKTNQNSVVSPSKKTKVSCDSSFYLKDDGNDINHTNGNFFPPSCSPLANKHVSVRRVNRMNHIISSLFNDAVNHRHHHHHHHHHEDCHQDDNVNEDSKSIEPSDVVKSNSVKSSQLKSNLMNADSYEPLPSFGSDQSKWDGMRMGMRMKLDEIKNDVLIHPKHMEKEKNAVLSNLLPSQSQSNSAREKNSKNFKISKNSKSFKILKNSIQKQNQKLKESFETVSAKIDRNENQGQRKLPGNLLANLSGSPTDSPFGNLPGSLAGTGIDDVAENRVTRNEMDQKRKKISKKITNSNDQSNIHSYLKSKSESKSKSKSKSNLQSNLSKSKSKSHFQAVSSRPPLMHDNLEIDSSKHVHESHVNSVNAYFSSHSSFSSHTHAEMKSELKFGRDDIEEIELMGEEKEERKEAMDEDENDKYEHEGDGENDDNDNDEEDKEKEEEDDYNENGNENEEKEEDEEEEEDDDENEDDENETSNYHDDDDDDNEDDDDNNSGNNNKNNNNSNNINKKNHESNKMNNEKYASGKGKRKGNTSSPPSSSPSTPSLQNSKNEQSKNKKSKKMNSSFPSIAHSFSEMNKDLNTKRKFYFPLSYTVMANQLSNGMQNQNQNQNQNLNLFSSPHLPPSPCPSFSPPHPSVETSRILTPNHNVDFNT